MARRPMPFRALLVRAAEAQAVRQHGMNPMGAAKWIKARLRDYPNIARFTSDSPVELMDELSRRSELLAYKAMMDAYHARDWPAWSSQAAALRAGEMATLGSPAENAAFERWKRKHKSTMAFGREQGANLPDERFDFSSVPFSRRQRNLFPGIVPSRTRRRVRS